MRVKPRFPADAFVGTASYYARYRPPYPEALTRDLLARAGLAQLATADAKEARLLDLGCGPGRVALTLAPSFREIWAVDPEPEMLEVAKMQAAERGLNQFRFILGPAEALEAPAASFELITIGEAFHRMDQPLVAKRAIQWLKPGGCIASMGGYPLISGGEPWQRVVADVVRRWTNPDSATFGKLSDRSDATGPHPDEGVFRAAGFEDVQTHRFTQPYVWTFETILGNLYSTSYSSRRVLGEKRQAFESDLMAALIACDPGGVYRENLKFGYTLGRKPAGAHGRQRAS